MKRREDLRMVPSLERSACSKSLSQLCSDTASLRTPSPRGGGGATPAVGLPLPPLAGGASQAVRLFSLVGSRTPLGVVVVVDVVSSPPAPPSSSTERTLSEGRKGAIGSRGASASQRLGRAAGLGGWGGSGDELGGGGDSGEGYRGSSVPAPRIVPRRPLRASPPSSRCVGGGRRPP